MKLKILFRFKFQEICFRDELELFVLVVIDPNHLHVERANKEMNSRQFRRRVNNNRLVPHFESNFSPSDFEILQKTDYRLVVVLDKQLCVLEGNRVLLQDLFLLGVEDLELDFFGLMDIEDSSQIIQEVFGVFVVPVLVELLLQKDLARL